MSVWQFRGPVILCSPVYGVVDLCFFFFFLGGGGGGGVRGVELLWLAVREP